MKRDHPTADKLDRFPGDTILRRHGWRIVRRPKKGLDLWRYRDGEAMSAADALQSVADAIARAEGMGR